MSDAPYPRVLFQAVPPEVLELLVPMVGTAGVIDGGDTSAVHASDWDLVVSFFEVPYVPEGKHALTFGATHYPEFYTRGVGWQNTHYPTRDTVLLTRSVHVHEDVTNQDMVRLLDRTIVRNDPGAGQRAGIDILPPKTLSLVTAGAEDILWAGVLFYDDHFVWALPAETSGHAEWLATVLRLLHDRDPERFPGEPDWRRRSEWATPDMREALATLDAVEAERVAVLADLDRREVSARETVEATTSSGNVGMLRLLTEQGDELLQAAAQAFRSFGFDALDMDDHHDEKTGAKLEDLRVSWSESGNTWTALAEVKGYGKGAKANDVAQILGRPAMAFYKETGREPDGLWHVVNSFREQDPSVRPVALSSASDLVVLAANGGCFIDTRDLFRAWRDVEEGNATAGEVRASLMSARERWEWAGMEVAP